MGIGRRLLLDPDPTGPRPTDGSKRQGPYASEANFDTNMVIILAALLCALICALGLNSIVRCALRCGRRMSPDSGSVGGDEAAARTAAMTGLKKKALRAIPVTEYSGENIPATECPICLGEFAEGEKVRVLPKCNHGFHVRCIDTWLSSHSSCPTCRNSLLTPAVGSTRPASGAPDTSDVVVELQELPPR